MCEFDWSATAAWVQAIGSVIAIGIAIWVPFRLDKRARTQLQAEKDARARIVQASLLPNLFRLRSATAEFLEQESGQPSFLGVDRDHDDFDSDFFKLVPAFTDILSVAPDSGAIQKDLTTLSVLLFKANDLLSSTSKLQRDGYHAAWINHKDLFVGAATEINAICDRIIGTIESLHPARMA